MHGVYTRSANAILLELLRGHVLTGVFSSRAVIDQAGDRGELTVASHKLEKVSTRQNNNPTACLRTQELHLICDFYGVDSLARSCKSLLQPASRRCILYQVVVTPIFFSVRFVYTLK